MSLVAVTPLDHLRGRAFASLAAMHKARRAALYGRRPLPPEAPPPEAQPVEPPRPRPLPPATPASPREPLPEIAGPFRPSLMAIALGVSIETGLPLADLLAPGRARKAVVAARAEFYRRALPFACPYGIARFANRHHTTVLHHLGRLSRVRG